MPTLLKRTSTPPKAWTVWRTTSWQTEFWETSPSTKMERAVEFWAAALQAARVSWAAAGLTSAMVTLAPSRVKAMAAARPMPWAAPVMMTDLPGKVGMRCSWWFSYWGRCAQVSGAEAPPAGDAALPGWAHCSLRSLGPQTPILGTLRCVGAGLQGVEVGVEGAVVHEVLVSALFDD